jgi:hypothetical protein
LHRKGANRFRPWLAKKAGLTKSRHASPPWRGTGETRHLKPLEGNLAFVVYLFTRCFGFTLLVLVLAPGKSVRRKCEKKETGYRDGKGEN